MLEPSDVEPAEVSRKQLNFAIRSAGNPDDLVHEAFRAVEPPHPPREPLALEIAGRRNRSPRHPQHPLRQWALALLYCTSPDDPPGFRCRPPRARPVRPQEVGRRRPSRSKAPCQELVEGVQQRRRPRPGQVF